MGDPSPLGSRIIAMSSPFNPRYNFSNLRNSQNNKQDLYNKANLRNSDEILSVTENPSYPNQNFLNHDLIRSSKEFQTLQQQSESLQIVIEEMKSEMERTVQDVQTMRHQIHSVKPLPKKTHKKKIAQGRESRPAYSNQPSYKRES